MTWVLFVLTMLSNGAVQVESAGRFASYRECVEVAETVPRPAVTRCELRREVDA